MIGYLDSSALLRRLLREPSPLALPGPWTLLGSSVLLRVECFRTLERLHQTGAVDEARLVKLQGELRRQLEAVVEWDVTREVVERAAGSFSVVLATLDAMHLATALAVKREAGDPVTILTHDRKMALAAQGLGLPVAGV